MMRAVHFGAGNIGRGFIGLVLAEAGCKISFIDVEDRIVRALQREEAYTVRYASSEAVEKRVRGVSAIHGSSLAEAAERIADADIVTTAIGISALRYIVPALTAGIQKRLQGGRMDSPLLVIACENAIGGSSQLKQLVYEQLSEQEREQANSRILFPNAAVDRIVPLQKHEDPLTVTVEPFSEWVVEQLPEMADLPELAGVHYVKELEPYISRKLFTVNTGHATAAYHGFLRKRKTIQEAMADPTLRQEVYNVLKETGAVITRRYGFEPNEHEAYIKTTLERFANPVLTDDIARVGRSPIRKLSANDRFVRPARLAAELGLYTPHLALAMAAAFRFVLPEDAESIELQEFITNKGIEEAIRSYTGILPEEQLFRYIVDGYHQLGEGSSP